MAVGESGSAQLTVTTDWVTLADLMDDDGSAVMVHAGPDNRSPRPRRFFSMSIARDIVEPKYWHDGYAPHPSLLARPLSYGDLLDWPTAPAVVRSRP